MNTPTATSPVGSAHAAPELLHPTLNLMRVGYLVMGLGLAVVKWPLLLPASSLPLFKGGVTCLLTAMSLLAFLGLRYPVRLVPVLLFECI